MEKKQANGEAQAENGDVRFSGKESPKTKHGMKITFRLVLATFSAVMGSLQFGYNTGVINTPETVIKEFLNQSAITRGQEMFDKDKMTLYWSIVVSIFAIGGMVGGFLGGWWADFFGSQSK